MKKEWAAAQCGHAEIARAVALGEFLQPDGPEPRRAKRINKVQSCGRERGAAEQINGISYYILGYPAIILYPWLLTCYLFKIFLSNSSKRKHVLCLSFTDFTGIKANQRHGLALFRSLSMDKHHCTMLSCCTSWPPHTCMMQSDAKIQEAACSFTQSAYDDYASCKLNFGGHTF